jgi:hypothetical protein
MHVPLGLADHVAAPQRRLSATAYRRGRRFEYRVQRFFRRNGWFVVRQPRSAFPDLIAVRRGVVLLIECRVDGRLCHWHARMSEGRQYSPAETGCRLSSNESLQNAHGAIAFLLPNNCWLHFGPLLIRTLLGESAVFRRRSAETISARPSFDCSSQEEFASLG